MKTTKGFFSTDALRVYLAVEMFKHQCIAIYKVSVLIMICVRSKIWKNSLRKRSERELNTILWM